MTKSNIPALNIHEAKTHLSRYVAKVEEEGESILLCRNGEPVALLGPVPKELRPGIVRFGVMKGKLHVGKEFFEDLTEDELPGFGL